LVQPKHFGTRKGKVINLIAVEHIREKAKLLDYLGWNNDQLKKVTSELKHEGILEETKLGFKVDYNLVLEYKAYLGDEWAKKKIQEFEERTYWKNRSIRKNIILKKGRGEKYLVNRFRSWIKFKPQLKFDINTSHIYLTSSLLDDILKDQIAMARRQILVVTSCIEKCHMSGSLMDACERGVGILLVTRSPEMDQNSFGKRMKIRFHKRIKESKIELYYNDFVRAKVFILDNQVLSSSSLNLSSDSVAGKSWESGIVSIDSTNIIQATESFIKLLNDSETEYQQKTVS
jgi:hypothetical protein